MLNRLLTFVLSLALLAVGLMFSLVAASVMAIVGIVLGGWFWWKTRHLRRQMRETGFVPPDPSASGTVIDGEAIRTDTPTGQDRLLR